MEVAGYSDLVEIGRGASGTVYRARQDAVGRVVALKVLQTTLGSEEHRRYERECQLIASLSWHPRVVSIHDAGTTATGHPYLALEYLPAGSLAHRVRRAGALPPAEVAGIGLQVADALHAAAQQGIVHRDVKPSNLLVTQIDLIKLADFGIASLDSSNASMTSSLSGTLAYMAPELFDGARATGRSDIYALGTTLYVLLAAKLPFEADTPAALLGAVARSPLPDLRPLGIPGPLVEVIEWCAAKSPSDRPTDGAELMAAFREVCAGEGWPVEPTYSDRDRSSVVGDPELGDLDHLEATTVARDRGLAAPTPNIQEVPTGTTDPVLAPTVLPGAPADPSPPPDPPPPPPPEPEPAEPSDGGADVSVPTPPARAGRSRTTATVVAVVLALALVGAALAASRSNSDEPTSTRGGPGPSASGGAGAVANPAALPGAGDGCGKLDFDPDARRGGTFTTDAALTAQVPDATFDPAAVATRDLLQVTSALWDGLTDLDYTDLCAPKLRGAVAESWSSNPEATEFTFKLRKDARFSDGTPVLPSSFKAGWERAGSKDIDAHFGFLLDLLKDGWKLRIGSVETLPSIVADDEARTLTVTLEHPMADFPSVVANPIFSPVNAADLARVRTSTGWGDKGLTVGNGPFELESATADEVVLVPNQRWIGNVYGDEKVFLDRLVFRAPPVATQATYSPLLALDHGTIDSSYIPAGQVPAALQAHPNNTARMPATVSVFLTFGADDPELSGRANLELRRAISLAIDRTRINDEGYEGAAQIATGLTPPGIPGYRAALCDYCAHDLAAARAHLERWRKDGGTLTSPIRLNVGDPQHPDATSRIVEENLEKDLGLSVDLVEIPDSPPIAAGQPGECGICGLGGWSADHPTYDNFMELFSRSAIGRYNLARFDDPVFEQVLSTARAELDPARRAELYHRAEDIVLNQQTIAIPLLTGDPPIVLGDDVRNFGPQPSGYVPWERVSVGN